MSKINPGSNIHEDNDLRTATPGALEIPEPKMPEKNTYQCPVCNAVFKSRADYDSHALASHHPEPAEVEAPRV